MTESPRLQSETKGGKVKYWQAAVYAKDGSWFYSKTWWQEGSKRQTSTPVEVFGKNIGRANETSPEEQARSEFDSIVQKQRDKGYSEDGSKAHIPTKPMLAHKYKDRKHTVEYPCFVQPKLDGYRMLKEGNGTAAYTRGGKPHVAECVAHLMWDTGAFMTDGELMLPHMPPLQETSRAAKKFRPDVSPTLHYYVYDIVDPGVPFIARHELLCSLVLHGRAPGNVVLVDTIEVHDETELLGAHAQFTARGYEGTIIRSGDAGYEIGHRSNSLLKLKDFTDVEFLVVDVEQGKGSFVGIAVFVCETSGGYRFNVVPQGTMEYRAELWRTRKGHIGKWLTVRYQALTEDGAPQFPVGITLREEGEF
ncbi:MAG: hypothetical protein KOO63_03000 [Bacteroidales bacterium]|nr:hypothetical protein [Candidatus Latescibacterota bacterium]